MMSYVGAGGPELLKNSENSRTIVQRLEPLGRAKARPYKAVSRRDVAEHDQIL
jgi:hypothetical protein